MARKRRPPLFGAFAGSARRTARQSFVGVIVADFVRQLDPDATARQRLAEQDLDFGVDAAQLGDRAPLHSVKNRFLRPEREGNAVRAWRPSSWGHDRSRIEGAGIDHRGDLAVANQDNEQIRDHCGLALRIEGVGKILLVEFLEGVSTILTAPFTTMRLAATTALAACLRSMALAISDE